MRSWGATLRFWLSDSVTLRLCNIIVLHDQLHNTNFSTLIPVYHIVIIVQVPVLNGGEGETILLKDLVYNFVYDAGPIHAIDDMEDFNENCNS